MKGKKAAGTIAAFAGMGGIAGGPGGAIAGAGVAAGAHYLKLAKDLEKIKRGGVGGADNMKRIKKFRQETKKKR